MTRTKTKLLGVWMDPDLDAGLTTITEDLGLTKAEVMRRSLSLFLNDYMSSPNDSVVKLMGAYEKQVA